MARMKKLLNEVVTKKLNTLQEEGQVRPPRTPEQQAKFNAWKSASEEERNAPGATVMRVRNPETGQIEFKVMQEPSATAQTRNTLTSKRGRVKTTPITGAAKMSPKEYETAIDAATKELQAWTAQHNKTLPSMNMGKSVPKAPVDPDNPAVDAADIDLDVPEYVPSRTRAPRPPDEEDKSDFDIDKVRGRRMGRDPLAEGVENRAKTDKLNVVLAELSQHLEKSQEKKLAELFVEVDMLAESMNKIPYSIFTHDDWKMLKAVYMLKLKEMQDEIEKLQKDKKDVDFHKVMKVIELMLTC